MRLLKLSTARDISVFMALASDHVSGATGLSLTITAGKSGAAFGSISPSVTERGNGWYTLSLTTSHTDTLGDLAFHITAALADPSDFVCHVVAFDFADAVSLGLSRIDAAITSRATPADIPSVSAIADQVWDELIAGHAVSGSTGATLSAIKAKTDTIGSLSVSVTSPVATDGTISIVPGDDYFAADGRSIDIAVTGASYTLVGATGISLAIRLKRSSLTLLTLTGSAISSTTLRFEPTAAQTALLADDTVYDYQVQATILATSHVTTVQEGALTTLLNL